MPLFALFLATFAIGTTEFVVAGILPNVAGDLGVSIPTAGFLISGYAAGVAIGGPIVAIVTAGFERRATLLGLMTLFILGNVLCALSPAYGWLMAARLVISLSHGAFIGIAAVAAASLVPPERRAGAVALLLAGISSANVFGVPLGTAIGGAFGWRMTFWAIAALGAVALAGIVLWVPRVARGEELGGSVLDEIRVLGRPPVYLSLATIVVAAAGYFAVFAYVAPFITDVVGAPANALPWLLVLLGLGLLVGNLAAGKLGDWKLMPSVIAIFIGGTIAEVLLLAGFINVWYAAVVLVWWAATGLSFAAPLQTRILTSAAEAPNLASTLVSTAFNVGIASGAALGSVALSHGFAYARLPWFALAGVLAALVLSLLALQLDRRAIAAAGSPA